MIHYDNDIEMLEAYLDDTMSPGDREELETRLQKEPELAKALQLHQLTIAGIRAAAALQNQELGQALQGISTKQMQEILAGKREQQRITAPAAFSSLPQPQHKGHRRWAWAASVAAVFILAIVGMKILMPKPQAEQPQSFVAKTQVVKKSQPKKKKTGRKNASPTVDYTLPNYDQEALDLANAVFACKNGVGLEEAIPILEKNYAKTKDKKIGLYLAEAYMKLNQPQKAFAIASDLEKHFSGDRQVKSIQLKSQREMEKSSS